jgi:hypothetical protein
MDTVTSALGNPREGLLLRTAATFPEAHVAGESFGAVDRRLCPDLSFREGMPQVVLRPAQCQLDGVGKARYTADSVKVSSPYNLNATELSSCIAAFNQPAFLNPAPGRVPVTTWHHFALPL